MVTVNVQETSLGDLLSRVDEGETVLLERNGSPVARVTPELAPQVTRRPGDGFGFLKGKFRAPDDIKTPFAAEIEEMFYGNPDKFSDKIAKQG